MISKTIDFFTFYEMDAKVMVLSAKLTLNTTLPQQVLAEFSNMYFDIIDEVVTVPVIDWFGKESFEEELDNLRAFLHQAKTRVKGEVLVYVKEEDEVYQGRYKLTTSQMNFERCDLNITVKKQKAEKPKTLTEAEKLDLFREYWEKKQAVPGKSEVYKGFRIGAFYNTMMKNQNTIELLNQIMNDG